PSLSLLLKSNMYRRLRRPQCLRLTSTTRLSPDTAFPILWLQQLGQLHVGNHPPSLVGEQIRLNRDSPDDSRTGVNIGAFPAFLQDRRKVWTAIDTSRNRNGGRGADLLIFAGIRTHSSRRLLLSA